MRHISLVAGLLAFVWICASLLSQAIARDFHVAPNGAPDGAGTKAAPLDFATALARPTSNRATRCGWPAAATRVRSSKAPPRPARPKSPSSTALPGQRVTLTTDNPDSPALLLNGAAHTWFWGMEITPGGIDMRGGREIKLINLVIHDCPRRTGIAGSNLGSEFYGCLVYRCGLGGKALAHGTYTQNRPEDVGDDLGKLPWKIHRDCIVFNNFGWGVHSYATSPKLANILYDGVVAFGNGMPKGADKPTANLLAGGLKFDDNIILRDCFTYYPDEGNFKRGADLGYQADNGRVTVERCHFIGGRDALWTCRWQQATFRNNVFFTNNGHANVVTTPADFDIKRYAFEQNTYYKAAPPLLKFQDTDHASLADWQRATGLDKTSRQIDGPPKQPWVFLRPNRYETDKAFLIVYNWGKTPTVKVDLAAAPASAAEDGRPATKPAAFSLKRGQRFAIVNVEDIWGKPVFDGTFDGAPISFQIDGSYAPEFACYVIRQDI